MFQVAGWHYYKAIRKSKRVLNITWAEIRLTGCMRNIWPSRYYWTITPVSPWQVMSQILEIQYVIWFLKHLIMDWAKNDFPTMHSNCSLNLGWTWNSWNSIFLPRNLCPTCTLLEIIEPHAFEGSFSNAPFSFRNVWSVNFHRGKAWLIFNTPFAGTRLDYRHCYTEENCVWCLREKACLCLSKKQTNPFMLGCSSLATL